MQGCHFIPTPGEQSGNCLADLCMRHTLTSLGVHAPRHEVTGRTGVTPLRHWVCMLHAITSLGVYASRHYVTGCVCVTVLRHWLCMRHCHSWFSHCTSFINNRQAICWGEHSSKKCLLSQNQQTQRVFENKTGKFLTVPISEQNDTH